MITLSNALYASAHHPLLASALHVCVYVWEFSTLGQVAPSLGRTKIQVSNVVGHHNPPDRAGSREAWTDRSLPGTEVPAPGAPGRPRVNERTTVSLRGAHVMQAPQGGATREIP